MTEKQISKREAKRLILDSKLRALGVTDIYFQPGPNLSMKFPCIVYQREKIDTTQANNRGYIFDDRYQITSISQSHDDLVVDKLLEMPHTTHERQFIEGNLYHDVFVTYI